MSFSSTKQGEGKSTDGQRMRYSISVNKCQEIICFFILKKTTKFVNNVRYYKLDPSVFYQQGKNKLYLMRSNEHLFANMDDDKL